MFEENWKRGIQVLLMPCSPLIYGPVNTLKAGSSRRKRKKRKRDKKWKGQDLSLVPISTRWWSRAERKRVGMAMTEELGRPFYLIEPSGCQDTNNMIPWLLERRWCVHVCDYIFLLCLCPSGGTQIERTMKGSSCWNGSCPPCHLGSIRKVRRHVFPLPFSYQRRIPLENPLLAFEPANVLRNMRQSGGAGPRDPRRPCPHPHTPLCTLGDELLTVQLREERGQKNRYCLPFPSMSITCLSSSLFFLHREGWRRGLNLLMDLLRAAPLYRVTSCRCQQLNCPSTRSHVGSWLPAQEKKKRSGTIKAFKGIEQQDDQLSDDALLAWQWHGGMFARLQQLGKYWCKIYGKGRKKERKEEKQQQRKNTNCISRCKKNERAVSLSCFYVKIVCYAMAMHQSIPKRHGCNFKLFR